MATIDQEKAHRFFQQAFDEEDKNNLPGALTLIDQALEISPDVSSYWAAKGHFLCESGKYLEAKAAAERSVKLFAGRHEAWSLLGRIENRLQNYKKAAHCFRQALQVRESVADYTLLAASELQFDPASAIISARKALELDPDWEEAQLALSAAKRLLDGLKRHESDH